VNKKQTFSIYTTMRLSIFTTVLLGLTLCILNSGCEKTIRGNGKIITQQRTVEGFNGISIKGGYDVYLTNSINESLVIEADENLFEYISTEVQDSILVVSNLKTFLRSKKLRLAIGYRTLNSLDFSGATELTGDTSLMFKDLSINISGAGKINLDLFCRNLSATISGGADIQLRGEASNLTFIMTGAGNINALNLVTENCKVDISGFGKAKLNVTKNLYVNISGAGKIEYKGEPELKKTITGAGKIFKLPG
jgi:hypothetical protein